MLRSLVVPPRPGSQCWALQLGSRCRAWRVATLGCKASGVFAEDESRSRGAVELFSPALKSVRLSRVGPVSD